MTLSHENQNYILKWRRYFHQYPELPMKEYKTADVIEKELQNLGIQTHRIHETGICGVFTHITDLKHAKSVGLRADIDALPVTEKTGLSFASVNSGVMHACGHDGHTAALLGAAKRLTEHPDHINGTVKFFFQQGEEICQGAKLFVKANEHKDLDRILAVHMCSSLPVGKMSVRGGECSASCDKFIIKIHGKSSHAATPHQSIDAIYVASQIVVNLQSIIARGTNPIETGVVSVGSIHGGTTYNIISDEVILEGTTRAFNQEVRNTINRRVKEIAEGIAMTYGAIADVEIQDFTRPLINDQDVANEVAEVAINLFGGSIAEYNYNKVMLGDDFAEYLTDVKGMYVWIGSSDGENTPTSYPHHHEQFDINEKAVLMASELYEAYARKILNTL